MKATILLSIASIFMIVGCANDSKTLQIVGVVSDSEVAILQDAADKWCEAGLYCIHLTRSESPDKLYIDSGEDCVLGEKNSQEILKHRNGCSLRDNIPLNGETYEIHIKSQPTREGWENKILPYVALHEFGHYTTDNILDHIVTDNPSVVMRQYNTVWPTELTPEDIAWAKSLFVDHSNETPSQ